MRIQTLHQLECQSPLISPKEDLQLTRRGLTVIQATKLTTSNKIVSNKIYNQFSMEKKR